MPKTNLPENEQIRSFVRERYGEIAEQADDACGCAATGCCAGAKNAASYGERLGYTTDELAAAPAGADLGLSCGNPLAIRIRPVGKRDGLRASAALGVLRLRAGLLNPA